MPLSHSYMQGLYTSWFLMISTLSSSLSGNALSVHPHKHPHGQTLCMSTAAVSSELLPAAHTLLRPFLLNLSLCCEWLEYHAICQRACFCYCAWKSSGSSSGIKWSNGLRHLFTCMPIIVLLDWILQCTTVCSVIQPQIHTIKGSESIIRLLSVHHCLNTLMGLLSHSIIYRCSII